MLAFFFSPQPNVIFVPGTSGPSGSNVQPVYCAINGKFKFTYSANNGQYTCPRSVSELSNCPFGMGLNVKFTECSFEDLGESSPKMTRHLMIIRYLK